MPRTIPPATQRWSPQTPYKAPRSTKSATDFCARKKSGPAFARSTRGAAPIGTTIPHIREFRVVVASPCVPRMQTIRAREARKAESARVFSACFFLLSNVGRRKARRPDALHARREPVPFRRDTCSLRAIGAAAHPGLRRENPRPWTFYPASIWRISNSRKSVGGLKLVLPG